MSIFLFNNLIIQFGKYTYVNYVGTIVEFPLAFTTKCSVCNNDIFTPNSAMYHFMIQNITLTNFNPGYPSNVVGVTLYGNYIAIGY